MLSTVALVVSVVVVTSPSLFVALTDIFRFEPSIEPWAMVYEAVHVPELLVAATTPPPNWLKSTVTELISLLLSPVAVLFQMAVTVSPILNAPPVPVPLLMEILASVTTGGA
ncbi:MAG TPA: hypothetical protein VN370_10170 [Desulfitobacteriaceae bacterium]|nr:hypothetical protein [Desulfitobacteriaceae bacterium]